MSSAAGDTPRLARVIRAPLGALLRGRTQHLWQGMIARAELPAPLHALATEVVKRTRLWPGERADVARELCTHFADGLSAGRAPDELARAFGGPRDAARMIRRAKRRCRPLLWFLWLRAWQALGAFVGVTILFYAVLLVRFSMGEPTITRNFTREINQSILSSPPEDRAWPVYARVVTAFGQPPVSSAAHGDFFAARPGDPEWDALAGYLRAHSDDLDELRLATRLPAMGLPLTDAVPPELHGLQRRVAAASNLPEPTFNPPSDNPMMVSVLLPNLGHARMLARALCADARLACSDGDPERALADWTAALDLSAHQVEHRTLISALVSIAIDALVFERVGEALAEDPSAFTDAQLARLAHRLGAVREMPLADAMEGERAFFLDVLQRAYTDDGKGDGRITPEGFALMHGFTEGVGSDAGASDHFSGAALLAIDVGRKRMRETHERVLDATLRYAQIRLWRRGTLETTAEIERIAADPIRRASMMPIVILTPALEKAALAGDFHALRRDVTLTVIALELHRRRQGAYPATLDALVPAFIPAVATDLFIGEPVRYLLGGAPWSDGKPVLYSVGANLEDDGGEVVGPNAQPHWQPREVVERWKAGNDPALRAYRGDWILWPKPPEPKKPAE